MKKLFYVVLMACLTFLPFTAASCSLAAQTHDFASLEDPPGDPERETASDELTVLFINVGKADAALLRYDGKAYLIDTGKKASAPALFGAMNLLEVDRLDSVFLTHTDSDHLGGMNALARYFTVEKLYSSLFSLDKKKGGNKIDELAQDLQLPQLKLNAGDKVFLSEDVCFSVLGPILLNEDDDNDNSLVLKLDFFGRTLLFMGDAQFAGENALLRSGADLDADILKVGNHGNPDATGDQFAAAVSPAYAIVSTDTTEDENSANERVLAALNDANVFLTQDFAVGVMITVKKDGSVRVTAPILPRLFSTPEITGVDRDTQTVTVMNSGADMDISGFMIQSQRGSEVFMFPEGSLIKSGQTVSVSTRPGADYLWQGENEVWHEKKQDSAFLYDRFGNVLSRWD